ncbi:hypothetical protein DEU56DRAFT_910771 [Suillus clintonianus]|uniref:uncharacterized protein n=1 Tax=Suillus clintonianus TaxID=1904413 RepID=UPI001B87DCAF|nr:uncharacterized protein DEU56DRAFT_910771 [Suillus clintonianus]KAG2143639.1 hypothetical protein DEU56DRAFT_910771 [Suillus clintonianus]
MKSLTSLKASPRPILKITTPASKNTPRWRSVALLLRSSSSAFSWKRLVRRSRKNKSFQDAEAPTGDISSSSSETLVGSPMEEKLISPKMVRFDDSPTYFGGKRRIKSPKSPTHKGALRSCLIINNTDPFMELLSDDDDDVSAYEDCRNYYPGFVQDMEDLVEREYLKRIQIEESRTPAWQLTEFGCTKMDRQDYVSHCFRMEAERKARQEAEGLRKVVYDHPMTLRWPSREITERPVEAPPVIVIVPPRPLVPDPAPVILNWRQEIARDIIEMFITLCIGLTIHMCIYILGIYCYFTGVYLDDDE